MQWRHQRIDGHIIACGDQLLQLPAQAFVKRIGIARLVFVTVQELLFLSRHLNPLTIARHSSLCP